MGQWVRKGTKMEYYEGSTLIKSYETNLKTTWEKMGTKSGGLVGFLYENFKKDKYKTNDAGIRGQVKHVEKAIQKFLETGVMPSADDIGVGEGKPYNNVIEDVRTWLLGNGINEIEYSANPNKFLYSKVGGERNPDAPEAPPEVSPEDSLNPYTAYLEEQRVRQERAELGLLNKQTRAGIQNSEISTQQAMIQQAQFKDQLVEQIKTDRLSKMRAGLTPMQIAQEDLQFMVGNMQSNNQNMQMMNQQRLTGIQQQAMNPYQAYINANAAATGGQGYGNVATGFAATDAGDLYQQALRIAQSQGRQTISQQDLLMAQGQFSNKG